MLTEVVRAALAAGPKGRHVDAAVIHTEGDGRNNDTSMASIRAYHMLPVTKGGRGWTDIGYHIWIRMTGLVELGRPLNRAGSHVKGLNLYTVGIGLAGDGDIADFTLAQYDSLFEVCWLLQAPPWGIATERFIGHREAPRLGAPDPKKTCPGKKVDLDKFRAMLAEPR